MESKKIWNFGNFRNFENEILNKIGILEFWENLIVDSILKKWNSGKFD